jgi:hypothetical protein
VEVCEGYCLGLDRCVCMHCVQLRVPNYTGVCIGPHHFSHAACNALAHTTSATLPAMHSC